MDITDEPKSTSSDSKQGMQIQARMKRAKETSRSGHAQALYMAASRCPTAGHQAVRMAVTAARPAGATTELFLTIRSMAGQWCTRPGHETCGSRSQPGSWSIRPMTFKARQGGSGLQASQRTRFVASDVTASDRIASRTQSHGRCVGNSHGHSQFGSVADGPWLASAAVRRGPKREAAPQHPWGRRDPALGVVRVPGRADDTGCSRR